MRTVPLVAFAIACNTFTTVEEACLEEVPGAGAATRPTDVELHARANCHRRLAKRPRARVDRLIQGAVEGHRDWLELNAPDLSYFSQDPSTEGFTGRTARARLDAQEYVFPTDSALLEIVTWWRGPGADQVPRGGEYFDFWFEDPFIRAGWLQPTIYGAGAAEADFTVVFPEALGFDDEPVHLMYWNVVYAVPRVPYAEIPVAYPRNGMTGVPADYTHITGIGALELGRTYGFPITFTVGSTENDVRVTQASMVAGEAQVPFTALSGSDATAFGSLTNTVIIVPDEPLQTGATYTVNVRISSSQGERSARTTFTVGGESRVIPSSAREAALNGIPAYDVSFRNTDPRDRELDDRALGL